MHRPLQQPYEGSVGVITRHDETSKDGLFGRVDTVSVGCLKVVCIDASLLPNSLIFGVNSARLSDDTSLSPHGP